MQEKANAVNYGREMSQTTDMKNFFFLVSI